MDNKKQTKVVPQPDAQQKLDDAAKTSSTVGSEPKKDIQVGQPKASSTNESSGVTEEQIKKDALTLKHTFGSSGEDDINRNLGSFTKTVKEAEQPVEVKLEADSKVVEQASKEKINFERFTKTRKDLSIQSKSKFGEQVGLLLRSRKGLKWTWVIEITAMLVVMIISIVLIACFTKYVGWTKEGPMTFGEFQGCLKTGLVFLWISIFPCLIPLIYLLTTWFIGINAVASSKLYHYFFWITGAVSLLCFLIGIFVMIYPWSELSLWGGDKLVLITNLL